MAIKNKLVLSTLVNQNKLYSIDSFATLDSYLVANKPSIGSDGPIRTRAISLIIQTFSLLGIKDPILSVTGRYFTIDGLENLISNEGRNNPFNFYLATVEKNINIEIDNTKFIEFCNTYLPQIYSDIVSSSIVKRNIIELFIDALIENLSTVGELSYSAYSSNVLSDRQTTYETSNFLIEPSYNFYANKFEEYFSNNVNFLPLIPNYYSLYELINNFNLRSSNYYLTFNGNIRINKNIGSDKYYNEFSNHLQASSSTSMVNGFLATNTNFMVDSVVDKTSIGKEDFPYSNTITFSNNQEFNNLDQFLIDKQLHILGLINFIFYSTSSTDIYTKEETNNINIYSDRGTYKDSSGRSYNLSTNKSITFQNQITSIDYDNIYSINSFGTFKIQTVNVNYPQNIQFLNILFKQTNDPTILFTYVDLQKELNNLYKDYVNYSTVYNLQELQRITTLGYAIEKRNSDGVLLQTIYLPKNNNNLDTEYLDTQIPYKVEVQYDVYSIDITPTINYNFTNIVKSSNKSFSFDINTLFTPKITKNLLFTKKIKLNDNPPVPPLLNFVTYQNINNLITLNITTQVSELTDTPINILQTDSQTFSNIYNNSNRTDGKLLFKTNDPLKSVQIFIIANNKPKSYADFQNATPIEVLMNGDYSKSINLQVTPNTKYYFVCRAIDIHNLISNPTSVYEVEIVSDSGAIYPLINTVNFHINKNYDVKKSFKKYLHIKPAIEYTQLTLNEVGQPQLGLENQSLWGQKYKVRVTSKKSGKSFDINLTYNKKEQDST